MTFKDLTAVVTGGASGIGAATAARLAARGARVAVLDRNGSTAPDNVSLFEADVTDDAAVKTAIAAVANQFGGIDILINNAGIGSEGDIAANPDSEWHHVLDVNVVGTARVSRAALEHLRKSAHAVIINVASVAAHVGIRNRAVYSASKGAIVALTQAMAADFVGQVRVNAVSPGTAATPWVDRLLANATDPDAAAEALRLRQPIGRLVNPEEIAEAIVSLASPGMGALTGAVLSIDGGMAHLRP